LLVFSIFTYLEEIMSKDSKIWGRTSDVSLISYLGTLGILLFTPFMVFYFYVAVMSFGGSLWEPAALMMSGKMTLGEFWTLCPSLSGTAFLIFGVWFLLQVCFYYLPDILHAFLPNYVGGNCLGAVTPAGNQLRYNINGLQAWCLSHLLFLMATALLGWFSASIIFDNWGGLLWVVNIVGYAVAIFAFVKAYYFPSHPQDRKFSGNFLYDFYMGIELNPRIGQFDFKLFFNGRPGIVAWTLINISFAAAQYNLYGYVTNSMILVNFLHALYVVYFFWNEAWYLRTIDIHHDHFGWMLAWGDCVWLPYMYTLQGFYLVMNPVQLSLPFTLFVLAFGLLGYFIFHSANRQKDLFRKSDGEYRILGKPASFLEVSYSAADGKERRTKLLTSGWWGMARHSNYTGDLILSLAYSLACGFEHVLPYFYFFFLGTLLIHRCIRDEDRCRKKYGEGWNEYCRQVPYRLIPGIF